MNWFLKNKKLLVGVLLLILFPISGCKTIVDKNELSSEEKDYIKKYVEYPKTYYVDKEKIFLHIEELSSEKYSGRKVATSGEKEAALYLARQLKKIGASPYNGIDYFQEFSVPGTTLREADGRYFLEPLATGISLKGDNVLGIFKNEENHDYIVISANYDSLGLENGGKNRIFPGANANASGTAAVLEVARIIGKNFEKLNYNVVIAFWSGNETGLNGSKKFLESLQESEKENIKIVINLDTIGSFGTKKFVIWSENDAPDFIIAEMLKWKEISLFEAKEGEHCSDHYYFAMENVPAITILSENWMEGTATFTDTQYGVNTENVRILSQYLVNYLFSLEGEADA